MEVGVFWCGLMKFVGQEAEHPMMNKMKRFDLSVDDLELFLCSD